MIQVGPGEWIEAPVEQSVVPAEQPGAEEAPAERPAAEEPSAEQPTTAEPFENPEQPDPIIAQEPATPSQVRELPEFTLKGLPTSQMVGLDAQIPGTWYYSENAYPQLESFAYHEQQTIADSSKASVIALVLPDEFTLADVLEDGELILPTEIDGQEIQWEAEGHVIIDENNRVRAEQTEKEPGGAEQTEPEQTEPEQTAQTEADNAAEEKTYTADELKDAIKEQTRSVADVDLQKRIAQADLKELQSELEDGVVYAKKDGIVTTVCDPANPPKDGTPFLQLSGASGLYISGTIGELDLDAVKVGQSVSAVNYMTGDTYEGTISEISNVPSDSVNYYGDSNPNSSFYEYTAYIENPQNLKKGDSLELTIDTSSEGSDSGLYIDKSYVRTENGQSYIYKDDNGKLKKQSVKTGKSLWGSYVEIKSGLTNDDYIAFPYGVREGEKTKVSEDGMY